MGGGGKTGYKNMIRLILNQEGNFTADCSSLKLQTQVFLLGCPPVQALEKKVLSMYQADRFPEKVHFFALRRPHDVYVLHTIEK